MKYLSHYTQDAQTELFNKTGTFFAFNKTQYEAGAKKGIKYVSVCAGMICPKDNVKTLVDGLEKIQATGIAQDLAENGKQGVIVRELHNHEAFLTGNISDTVDALDGYGISREEVLAEYKRIAPTIDY